MAEKRTFKKKITKNISFLPEMPVFDKKCQILTENDDYFIKYAYFLKTKSTKRRGGVPSAKILGVKNDL